MITLFYINHTGKGSYVGILMNIYMKYTTFEIGVMRLLCNKQ